MDTKSCSKVKRKEMAKKYTIPTQSRATFNLDGKSSVNLSEIESQQNDFKHRVRRQ